MSHLVGWPSLTTSLPKTSLLPYYPAPEIFERAAIQTSLKNLCTFPWIDEAVKQQRLQLHGWYFDIAQGQLLIYNHTSMSFELAQAN